MPLFEFRCGTCHHDIELLVRQGDEARCPQCGSTMQKLFSETASPVVANGRSLPVTSACPPGNAPCSPTCCRL